MQLRPGCTSNIYTYIYPLPEICQLEVTTPRPEAVSSRAWICRQFEIPTRIDQVRYINLLSEAAKKHLRAKIAGIHNIIDFQP